jgi:hypothetical protein
VVVLSEVTMVAFYRPDVAEMAFPEPAESELRPRTPVFIETF